MHPVELKCGEILQLGPPIRPGTPTTTASLILTRTSMYALHLFVLLDVVAG